MFTYEKIHEFRGERGKRNNVYIRFCRRKFKNFELGSMGSSAAAQLEAMRAKAEQVSVCLCVYMFVCLLVLVCMCVCVYRC